MQSILDDSPRRSSWFAPFALLVLAIVLCSVGVWSVGGLVARLPVSRVNAFKHGELTAAQQAIGAEFDSATRDAVKVWEAGRLLTTYIPPGRATGDPQGDVMRAYQGATPSDIVRMHMVAARMLALERTQQPLKDWWPSLKPFLDGTATANMPTLERRFVTAFANGYATRLALGAGTATELAESTTASEQHAMLQYLASNLRRVVDERRAASDGQGAATASLAFCRLCTSIILGDEPAHSRLLAADLLARFLAAEPADIRAESVINGLRAWRAQFKSAARARGETLLGIGQGVDLVPDRSRMVMATYSRAFGVAVAAIVFGVLALALAWPLLSWGGEVLRRRAVLIAGAAGAVLAVVVLGAVQSAGAGQVVEDFLRARIKPLHELVMVQAAVAASLATAAVLGFAAVVLRGKLSRLAAAGGACVIAWLCLSIVLLGSVRMAESARADYEAMLGVALRGDVIAQVAGPDTDKLLDPLRSWKP